MCNDQHLKIGTGQFIEAGQEIDLSSGLRVVLEGGSPGEGTGAAPVLPGPAAPVDADRAGALLIRALKPQP